MTEPIQIVPAILTDKLAEFERLWTSYTPIFPTIDIDVIDESFGPPTLTVAEVLNACQPHLAQGLVLTWDLMLAQPQAALETLQQFAAAQGSNFHYVVHQHADIAFTEKLDCHAEKIGIAVNGPEALWKEIQNYERFPLVQLMTIPAGQQGRKFMPEVLDKVTALRMMGYTGQIGLDGGINLRSAEYINAVNKEDHINRVSVGSYFQTAAATDLVLKKYKLELALNL